MLNRLFAFPNLVTTALAILFLGVAVSSTSARGPLDEGVEQYYYKRFHTAAMHFEQACAADPMNWKPHFYLARTLEQLKEYEAAKSEFEFCFRLNPFSKEGRMARAAVMDLAAARESSKVLAEDPQIIQQALRLMNSQTGDLKNRVRAEAERHAAQRMTDAAQRLNMPSFAATSNNGYRRWLYRNDEEVSNRSFIQNSYQRTDAMRESALARIEAAQRALETQKSAVNLKVLLADRSRKPGNARLRALGTNLYVRFYGDPSRDDVPPDDPVLQLKARAGSLADITPSSPYKQAFNNWKKSAESTYGYKPGSQPSRRPGAYHKFANW
ncbi:MAG: hypothetical protein IAF58_06585 [Leptolyngbya sp.]|nr:hypothetical protein [Candidatus Melainabacteria bacterium]